MTVYGDVVLAVNTVVNFLLLQLGARLSGAAVRPVRCLLGGTLGGVYAVVCLLPAAAPLASFPGQLLCFLLMCIMAYGLRRNTLRTGAVAFLCSMALAGLVYLLTQLFSLTAVQISGRLYYPIGARILILLAGLFYLAAALLAAGGLCHGRGEIFPLRLTCGERSVTVSALYDSGNTLTDPVSGCPVVILEYARGAELLGVSAGADAFSDPAGTLPLLAEKCPQGRLCLVPYRAVGVAGGLLIALQCRARVGSRRERKILAAISPTAVSDGGAYEALIGGMLF